MPLVPIRTHRGRTRLTAIVLSGSLLLGATPALAQDDQAQSLPDPDNPQAVKTDSAKKEQASALPTTGLEAAPLVVAGLAVLCAGIAIRPAARRRRSWSTDTWLHAVQTGDSPPDLS